MSEDVQRFSVAARPVVEVPLQGVTSQGEPKQAGISYDDPEKASIRGPYQTGCEQGRSCYELGVQRELTGLQITVRLAGQVPLSGMIGWWRTDTLSGFSNGDSIRTWPAFKGEHALNSLTDLEVSYLQNHINGLPALHAPAQMPLDDGLSLQTGNVFPSTGQGRQMILVCNMPPFMSGHLSMKGQVYTSNLDVSGWTTGYFRGLMVDGDGSAFYKSSAAAIRPTGWNIISIRFALNRSACSVRLGGVELASLLSLSGDSSLTRSTCKLFNVRVDITFGDAFEIAEVLAWNRGLEDTEIVAVEKYLAEKYALEG